MRKTVKALVLASVAAVALSSCSSSSSDDENSIVVGASPSPHAKILEFIRDNLAEKEGLKIEITQIDDYTQLNPPLKSKEFDANYFQTVPFLADQTAEFNYDFEAGAGVHLEPLAIYSDKLKDLKELKDGATVGIITDVTNQSRALELLAHYDLIKLPEGKESLSVQDIKHDPKLNPKNLEFKETEGPALVQALPDVDIAVINGDKAQLGNLSPVDSLGLESTDNNPNSNLLVWRKGDAKAGVAKLEKLLHSPEVKAYIEETWPDQSVIPVF